MQPFVEHDQLNHASAAITEARVLFALAEPERPSRPHYMARSRRQALQRLRVRKETFALELGRPSVKPSVRGLKIVKGG
jgi:hypothetical protein